MTEAAQAIKTSPRWQGLTTTGEQLPDGTLKPDKPIIITCTGHTQTGICPECLTDLTRILNDIPQLFDDLDIAIAGDAQFVEHGFRGGDFTLQMGGSNTNPAIAAHHRLVLALTGDGTGAHPVCSDWFDASSPATLAERLNYQLHRLILEPRMPVLAHDISSAAARAHHVIDIPKDLVYYGPCPDCGRDIVQERIHRDDQETKVRCRYLTCGYGEPLDTHQKRILDANLDRQFSIAECVGMISNAGKTVTRDQINGWIRHKGLHREWN